MKFKLTPELSYIIAIYGKKKGKKGIGVRGDRVVKVFVEEVLKHNLAPEGKLLYDKEGVYFYHSKLKKFFDKVLDEVSDRFIFLNDYASNYFAGVFDSVGRIENGKVYLGRYNLKEEIALQKLGFIVGKERGELVVKGRVREFLRFILPNLKIKKREVEELLNINQQ